VYKQDDNINFGVFANQTGTLQHKQHLQTEICVAIAAVFATSDTSILSYSAN